MEMGEERWGFLPAGRAVFINQACVLAQEDLEKVSKGSANMSKRSNRTRVPSQMHQQQTNGDTS